MKNDIRFEEKPGYLRCLVTGIDSLDFSIEYFTRVADECQQRGCTKALIIEELQGHLTTMETYTVAEKLPKLFRGIKLAFVDMVPEHKQENIFGETVAVNRALHAKVCDDEQAAVDWLRS
jgi:hypothetical protein